MAAQSLRSADKSSCVFTVRRPRLGSGCVRHRSAIFLSKALRFDCLAQSQGIAKNGLDAGEPRSTDTSEMSSKKGLAEELQF